MDSTCLFAHVDHVLVAEFDIDKGSSITYQYPEDTGTDVHMLADLMIPDGAHLREEDWTMFFLNQPRSNKDELPLRPNSYFDFNQGGAQGFPISMLQYSATTGWRTMGLRTTVLVELTDKCLIWDEEHSQILKEITSLDLEYRRLGPMCMYIWINDVAHALRFFSEDDEIYFMTAISNAREPESPTESTRDLPPSPPTSKEKPLLYVLNLVRTKHISGVRRGARVKAMALTSRHHWVHAFKPLLLLALDKYFNAPSESIVVELYNSINATDCSLIPPLSTAEKRILRSSEDRTLFEGKFGGDIGLDGERLAQRSFSVDSTATGLTVRDGQRPAGVSKATNKDRHFYETRASYSGIKVPIRIPLTIYPEEIGDFTVAKLLSCFGHSTALNPPKSSKDSPPPLQWKNGAPFCWHPHLDSGPQTHPLVVLLSALLTEKRVIFLGDKRPSGEVAQYVLAACSLAGGGGSIVRGFAERCFPYVSLAGLDTLLSVTGYVAGVTNPVFEEQPSWWDVLCNINTGKITVSPQLISAISPDSKELNKENEKDWMRTGYWEGDNEFVQETILAVQSHTGELHVRQRFHDYIRKLVDVCAAFEIDLLGPTKIAVLSQHTSAPELGYGPFFPDLMTRKREIAILRNRVEAWRQTTSYKKCQLDFQTFLHRRAIKGIDTRHILCTLRCEQLMADSAIVKVFFGLQDNLAFADDDMILELLSLLPQSQGGLFPIAAGLYHARWEVRRAVVRLLRRIGWHETGAKFIAHLNAFVLMTYQRVHQDFYKGEMPPGVAPLLTASPDGSGLFTDGMSTSESSLNRDMGASYLRNVEDNMRSTTESRISSNLRSVTGSTNSLEVRAPTVPDKSSNAIRTFLAPFGSYTAKGQGTPSPAQSPPRSSGGATPPSGTTTPPAPLSPVLRRILQQQQQQQNELKAKLTNIEKSTLPEDTMNPEFGQHLINSPKRIPPSKVAKRLSMDVSPEVIISSSNIQIQPQSSVTDSALSTSMSSSAKLASQDNDFSASARMTPTTLSPFDPTLSPSYSVSSVSSMSDSAQQINSPQRATFNQPRSRLAEASTHSDGHTALYPAQNSKTPGSLNGNFDDSRNPSNQDFVPPPFPAHAMPGSLVRPYPTKITPGGSSAPPADQVSPSRLTVHTASPDRDELPTAPLRKESMQKTMLSPSKSPNFDLPNSPSSSTTQRLSPRISTEGFATEDNSYDYLMDLYGMGSDDSASMSSANTSPVRTIPNSRLSK